MLQKKMASERSNQMTKIGIEYFKKSTSTKPKRCLPYLKQVFLGSFVNGANFKEVGEV